jgi:uncharacterized delta-60 repeat protein
MRAIDFRDFYNHTYVDEASAVAIQPDGKIVVAGGTGLNGVGDFALIRLNTDGSTDYDFSQPGLDGRVRIDLYGQEDRAYGVAIQPDGKIVVVGSTRTYTGNGHFGAARLNPDGTLDSGFGTNGRVSYGFYADGNEDSEALGVAIQSDGKIVLAGYTKQFIGAGTVTNFALARLLPDGELDTTFDGNGLLTTDFFGNDDAARAVAIQSNGKIVAAGYTHVSDNNYDFALARYNSDGSLDSTFSGDGKVNTDFLGGGDDGAYAMALQPGGKIVAAGGVHTISTGYDFGVARYLSNGSLDTGFPGGGFEAINFAGGTAEEVANGVAIQPDGRIVLAGYAPGVGWDFALARLLPSGAIDASFSGDGKLTTDFAGRDDRASALTIQPDGKIVTVGVAYMNTFGDNDFAIARYIGQGYPDFSISATPASATVLRGGRAQYSIVLNSIDGFSGYVTLSVGGLPSLTSGSFSPQTVFVPSGGTGTATLTVATSVGASQGTYTFTVTGRSGSISHAQNLTLVITGR